MEQSTLQELKIALENERDKLVAELKAIAKPDPKMAGDWDTIYPRFETAETGSSSSLEVEANEVEEYETRLEAEHSLESRLLTVTKALSRMEEGTYGICLGCKRAIPLERLRANPAAEIHIEHSA